MEYLLLKLDNEEYWLELDNNGYATRQILVENNKEIHLSCREDCLAEGIVDVDELLGDNVKLSKQEFSAKWQSVTLGYRGEWERTKLKYPFGECVQGICKFIYPQGPVIIGNDYMAIYKGGDSIEINQFVLAKVSWYDDINMWLVLK